MDQTLKPPFSLDHQLLTLPESLDHLLGFPYVPLRDENHVRQFIEKELCSDMLDAMADKLWWMSKQDSCNISPLHRQRVKGRQIIVSEDPKLHLVWIEDRIFVKPLPQYLLSYEFWTKHLVHHGENARVYKAALGFLRTFARLIRYESDFRIAQEPSLSLIPPNVTWGYFCNWAAEISRIRDSQVSERYRYGEIRLTRLNFYAPFLVQRSVYQRVDYQYSSYFTRFYGPILFMLAIFSLVLSGFQVLSSVPEGTDDLNTQAIYRAGMVVSVGFILITVCISGYLGALAAFKIAREWRVALRDRQSRHLEEGKGICNH
ncbi:subtilisin-like serine protease [Fusarium austroafricanum]|uniref:Subtilisin-like serine protease n=1 Tax=Fusarium austroafricanum TaxID=2364996 RepID=A0A8H4JYI5_9HYPO|nr:subtilisin-like serine protease [Fusarium austroafricanum]